jgi:hypothetical protein
VPFLESLRLLFGSEQNPIYSLVTDNDATVKSCLAYNVNNSSFATTVLIDKIFELTSYALRFYKLDLCNQTEVEKLLMLNLNQNFTNLRSDFFKPLQLIQQYLKVTKDFGSAILLSADACHFIRNVGINNSSLDQKIISLKLLDKIYSLNKNCFKSS